MIQFITHRILAQCKLNLEQTVAGKQETYPYRRKKCADSAKNSFGWCDTRDILCERQGFDGCVQRRGDTLPPLRSLGLGLHGRNSRWLREDRVAQGCVRILEPIQNLPRMSDERQFCYDTPRANSVSEPEFYLELSIRDSTLWEMKLEASIFNY